MRLIGTIFLVAAAALPTGLNAASGPPTSAAAPASRQWVARSDVRSTELFRRAEEVAEQARSLKARVSFSVDIPGSGGWNPSAPFRFFMSADVWLMKPNLLRVTVTGGPRKPPLLFTALSDGHYVYHSCPATRKYAQSPASAEGQKLEWFMGSAGQNDFLPAFFSPEEIRQLCLDGKRQYLGVRMREGQTYDVVDFRPYGLADEQELYFFGREGALDGLEVREVKSQRTVVKWWVQNVGLDADLTPSDFSFTPPVGFRRVEGSLTESFFWPSPAARPARPGTRLP